MNQVKVIGYKNIKTLKKRHKQIIDIWGGHHRFGFEYPKNCLIAYIDGYKGGVQVEVFGDAYSIVYFAGFEEKHRRKGFLKRCLSELNKHYPVVGAQIDLMDDPKPWQNLGYVNQVMVQFCPTYINISKQEWRELNSSVGNEVKQGVSPQDILNFIGEYPEVIANDS